MYENPNEISFYECCSPHSRRNLNIPGQSENSEFTFMILISLVFYSYTHTATLISVKNIHVFSHG